jgi:hypothetical protein
MKDDRLIEIEALEARIAKLQYRLFELRNEAPPEVPMSLHTHEYRAVADFGWRRDDLGTPIVGSCRSEDGNTGSYRFMIDRYALAGIRNRDVFSFWKHVLKRTIRHLAHEMYDPEQGAREAQKP